MVTLDDFCAYARIDVQDDSSTIQALLDSAETMIRNTTGKRRPGGNDAVYDHAVMMLAAHWYDNRAPTGSDNREIPYTMQWILNHISLCATYPEVSEIEPLK